MQIEDKIKVKDGVTTGTLIKIVSLVIINKVKKQIKNDKMAKIND
jgi:hypothetical protein